MDVISSLMSAIQLAIAAAPKVVKLYEDAKTFISALFSAGVISKADQDAMHAHVDLIQAAVDAGTIPPSWTVETDPA